MYEIQEYLFQRIKEKLPPSVSLADRIAEVLYISNDSAYRRIRGETPLVLEEAKTLCDEFGLSLDQLLKTTTDSILFHSVQLDNKDYSFETYLTDILNSLKLIASFEDKKVYYMAKDLPLFHHFSYRPLFAFRYFFWMKSVLQHPDFVTLNFSMNRLTPNIEKLGREIMETYNNIPSAEIWNTECVNSTIAQVEYYREAGYFDSEDDIDLIYTALGQTVDHVKAQAETGTKYIPGETPEVRKENFQFYYNRMVLGDNTIMAIVNGRKTLYLNYDILNYMMTQDEKFCNNVFGKLQNIMKRATIISSVSEKQRNIFFNILHRKIPKQAILK